MAEPAELPDTIGPLPWLNLSVDVDGSTRPCCKFAHASPTSPYQLANLRDTDLAGAWNSPAAQALRQAFRSGAKPAECDACWQEEAVGIRSFRQTYLDDRRIEARPDYDDLTPPQPAALDLKLSNSCNLKCRICGPVASSTWLNEELASSSPGSGTHDHLATNKPYYLSNKITGTASSAETLRTWAPRIEHLELTGGEPMMSRENREIVDAIVEHGHPERVHLLITTNATTVNQRVIDQLPHFGDVMIALSIDDFGPRLEYERAPAVWTEVLANMRMYASLAGPRCAIWCNCSVSVHNVWDLADFLDWMTANFRDSIPVNLNLVHEPRHYSIQSLPPELKQSITNRLLARAAAATWPERLSEQLHELVRFMNDVDDPQPAAWAATLDQIRTRDQVRGESFAEVFPSYHAELVRLGLWESAPSPDAPLARRLIARIRG